MNDTSATVPVSRTDEETDAIICCPSCLRPYPVHTSMAGKLARCWHCDANFTINTTELKMGGETAIVLRDPVSLRVGFIQEGCAEMARNISDLLKLAGEPVTREAILMIVRTIPCYSYDVHAEWWREGRCNKTLEKAWYRCQGMPGETRYREIMDYFLGDISRHHLVTLVTLIGAFSGVLSVEFDVPAPEPIPGPPVRRRGPLERWAEKMGW